MLKYILILSLLCFNSCVTKHVLDFSKPLESIVSASQVETEDSYTFKKLKMMPVTKSSYIKSDDIRTFIDKTCDSVTYSNMILSDSQYVKVDHQWMLETIAELQKLRQYFKVKFVDESFDCDNFASLSISLVNLVASYSELKAQVLVGRIDVLNKKTFANVPAGGGHALNFFVSEKGIFIFEPQNGTVIDLQHYPNKDYIFRVFLD
jgi:hypothetical protein